MVAVDLRMNEAKVVTRSNGTAAAEYAGCDVMFEEAGAISERRSQVNSVVF